MEHIIKITTVEALLRKRALYKDFISNDNVNDNDMVFRLFYKLDESVCEDLRKNEQSKKIAD